MPSPPDILIRNAALRDGSVADIRICQGRIAEIGKAAGGAGRVIDAAGGLLIPGLHDHHIHVAGFAAAMSSVRCGPPEVADEAALAAVLRRPGEGWLRGVGYHEIVTDGLIDRHFLDRINPVRKLRVQHRSGRMWIFNTAGLQQLLASGPPPASLERAGGAFTGRLFDDDAWLRRTLNAGPPGFAEAGARLAAYGVTGITEISPGNDDAMAGHFASEHANGSLPQRIMLAGRLELGARGFPPGIASGPVKLHLHEAALPAFDEAVALFRAAHGRDRGAAVHCVTETELVFTLAALREAGTHPGDRIEHASVTPDSLLEQIAELGLGVAVQPHFVAERGDAYRAMIPASEWPDLYRLRGFLRAGVPLAGGSDAPFGAADPWAAMRAAVSRRTAAGEMLGAEEALTPEEALSLFLADPADFSRIRTVTPGAPADLCLLDAPWDRVREDLAAARVCAAIIGGRIVHDRIDQAEAEGGVGADALAG